MLENMQVRFAAALAALAALVGLLHLVEAPEYLEEEPYIGVLFIVGGVALLAAVWGLMRRPQWQGVALVTGALVNAGMLVGGVMSRTVGLPGFKESDWEASLLISLVLEAAFLALAVPSLLRAASPTERSAVA